MADMDKALPNVETEIKTPSDEEVAISEQETIEEQVGPDDIDITQEEDGSATINFDPASKPSLRIFLSSDSLVTVKAFIPLCFA